MWGWRVGKAASLDAANFYYKEIFYWIFYHLTQELFKNLQAQITREVERARNEELRLDRKIDDEIARAKAEEARIEAKLDREITRSTQEDADIHKELDAIKAALSEMDDEPDFDGDSFWMKFPNGVILQAGSVKVPANTQYIIANFVKPFDHKCLSMAGSDASSGLNGMQVPQPLPATAYFNCTGYTWGGAPFNPRSQFAIGAVHGTHEIGNAHISWLAWGY